jgi:hypothetical protein
MREGVALETLIVVSSAHVTYHNRVRWFNRYLVRVFENEVVRRVFGPKREEVSEGWRKLHNEELHNNNNDDNAIRQTCSVRGIYR